MWYTPNTNSDAGLPFRKEEGSEFSRLFDFMSITQSPQVEKDSDRISVPQNDLAVLHSLTHGGQFTEYSLDCVLASIDAHAGSLFLWDECAKKLVLKAARGPRADQLRDANIKLREGVSGWVGDKGHSVLVKNVREDSRFAGVQRAGDYETPSFISLSLIAGNKLLGVLNITEKADHSTFTETDFDTARDHASHIAIAYENLRERERLARENNGLQERVLELTKTVNQQEPLARIGKLSSNLAHELNNPLDSIRRYVNLALDQSEEESLPREYLGKAKRGIRRAVQVIRGLLQFSRECSKSEIRNSDVHSVIERSLEAVGHDIGLEGINVKKDFCQECVFVPDGGLLVVFRNLIKNARQAISGAGEIAITTRVEGESVFIALRDTGAGMVEEVKDRLFEPFFSTKKESGTGIGLVICREVLEKSGGQISCTKSDTKGTEFLVILPYRGNR